MAVVSTWRKLYGLFHRTDATPTFVREKRRGITSSLHGPNGLGYRCVTLAGTTKNRHNSRIMAKPVVYGLCPGTRAHEVGVASNRGTARRGE